MTDLTQSQLERRDLIAQLFGAFGRTPKEHEFTGYEAALKLMSTPILARVVSSWLEKISEATEPEDLRVPTAGKLWQLKRKLRALPTAPPLTLHGAPEQKPDGWATNANLLLLAYFDGKRNAGVMARYAPDSPNPPNPGPLTRARTAVLVKWKNVWARDMREDRELYDGKLEGRAFWADCMARAEAELDEMIGLERAAA